MTPSIPAAAPPATPPRALAGGVLRAFAAAAWGVALWFAFALLIRSAPAATFARGGWTILLFAALVPSGWGAAHLTRRLLRLTQEETPFAVAVACAAAMMCDGVGLTWTTLYGPASRDLLPAAAALLWGVAWTLAAAVAQAHAATARKPAGLARPTGVA